MGFEVEKGKDGQFRARIGTKFVPKADLRGALAAIEAQEREEQLNIMRNSAAKGISFRQSVPFEKRIIS